MSKLRSIGAQLGNVSFSKRKSRLASAVGTAGLLIIPLATYALYSPAGSNPLPASGASQVKGESNANKSNVRDADSATPAGSDEDSVPDSNTTQVTVNGQSIPVPSNGSVHQTVPTSDGNGSTTIDVNSSEGLATSTTATTDGSGTTSVNINSSSHTDGSGHSSSSSSTFISNQSTTTNLTGP